MSLTMADIPEADHVYVLMTDRYRISRNIRAQWYLQNLNKRIHLKPQTNIEDFTNEIDIISYVPLNSDSQLLQKDVIHITPNTKFTFFSRKYCFVYILDLSASVANVDIQHSNVLSDEVCETLSKCLQNLVQPFFIPGSQFLFQPDIFLTIIAYNPFYSCDFHNVIVQGFKLCIENIDDLLKLVKEQIYFSISVLHQNIKTTYKHDLSPSMPRLNVIPADMSLVNIIRFGLLSLSLLPDNCQESIIIVTDGNISFPDANALESALAQLRLGMISCSFVQIGSPPHPDSSLGFVPYTDFMKFVSTATFGSYLTIRPNYKCEFEPNSFNLFHRAFLVWNFHFGFSSFSKELRKNQIDPNIWSIENPYFYSAHEYDCDKRDQQVLRRKQSENKINAKLGQILSYRLREGFTIKKVFFKPNENNIELLLVLPWRYNVNIEYHITAFYQPENHVEDDDQKEINYEIIVECNYSFLHDATCSPKKLFKSPYRATTIRQFWSTLKSFTDSDKLGIHFHNFAKNEVYRSIPESIQNGVPLFYLPPSSNMPVVSFTNETHLKFSQYWKPICMLDVNMCQKSSLHTHQINILLKHDTPLPQYLYQPNSSGRYDNIQCNQAMSVLNVMLKEWSSFVLLENHSYIKLIDEGNSSPCSFYLIRIISQPPCIVLHLAFIGGTSGSLRNQIVNELNLKLKHCKLPQRNLSSSLVQKSNVQLEVDESVKDNDISQNPTEFRENKDHESEKVVFAEEDSRESSTVSTDKAASSSILNNISCFILLNRPIERILIRYEKVPKDYHTCYKYEEDWIGKNNSHTSLNMFQTLTRYLHHKRFIWNTHDLQSTPRLNISSISKILSVLTMKRIQEGFNLAYNDCGIVNLVMELKMKDDTGGEFPCLVQYIIFPSNVFVNNKDSISVDDFEDIESNNERGEHLIVTECWIEPQNGVVANVGEHFLQGLDYNKISLTFYNNDLNFMSSLLTYEHLVAYTSYESQCKFIFNNSHNVDSTDDIDCSSSDDESFHRFKSIPFSFNLFSILDKSQQAVVKFSMLYQSLYSDQIDSVDPLVEDVEANGTPTIDASRNHLSNCINIMLYSEFLLKLKNIHDKEISFDHSDSITFINQVNQRLSTVYDNEDNVLFQQVNQLADNKSIVFRCFCKQISSNCIILTILPASFDVLRKLSFINNPEIEINSKLINELNVLDGHAYGSLVMPIFVHKLSFQSLTNILLNNELDDLAYCPDCNLMFDYSINSNKYYVDTNASQIDTVTLSDEIALEIFCKAIETLYWNSFTDAVYKSLRYGFEVDQRDIKLVLEQICQKVFTHVDITEFLIYTCKHLKTVLNVLYEKYSSQSIFDILDLMFCDDKTDSNDASKFVSLKNMFSDTSAHCSNSECLKGNLINLIQAHFSPIPVMQNNYYFYDYENIQAKQFSFGEIDVKKKNERLLEFYKNIENNLVDLGVFYEESKKSLKLSDQGMKENDNDDFNRVLREEEPNELSSERDSNFFSTLLTKPLFVGFSYSLMLKTETRICKSNSMPTCIMEILSLLSDDSESDIELGNFRAFLNIEIITQNLENTLLPPLKKLSVVSNEAQCNYDDISSFLGSTLDEFQVYKYFEFVKRIEWLIRDEIVSISHNTFKICSKTLQMVVEHIKKTGKSNTSFIDKVDLKFIVVKKKNEELSLSESLKTFRNLLRSLKFSNFQLYELGDYFYVIHRSMPYELIMNNNINNSLLLVAPSNNMDKFEESDILVFNEELFDDLPKESLVAEYTIEESGSSFSPNFWLILSFEEDESQSKYISLYFHSRQNIFVYGLEIFNQLKKSLESLCKKINQSLLLDTLYDKRMCDDLLISKEDKDPFIKNNIRTALNSTPLSHTYIENNHNGLNNNPHFDLDFESFENNSLKILRTSFVSGSFMCDVVWEKHFSLHPRLHSDPKYEAINPFKLVLSSFKVQNRNNLYVYKEKSGSVFYIRIYEVDCCKHVCTEPLKYWNSESSALMKNCFYDNIVSSNDFSYINNNDSIRNDSDRDTDSINSNNFSKLNDRNFNQQCVRMNVHGVEEPGQSIKLDMVGALQKKVDEAVLHILIFMLSRNPLSKLNYEDVCFIQSPNSSFKNFFYAINDDYYPYITNIKSYIRQNLPNSMFNPKYADSNREYHFKVLKNGEFYCVKDEDVFIFHCQQQSGKDCKGIACVILSIVSKEKIEPHSLSTFEISQDVINDFIGGNFENLTSCYSHKEENAYIKFYINFQVWYTGKIDMLFLSQTFIESIRNALWDFNLEFKIFKFCMIEDNNKNLNIECESTTPKRLNEKRERRSGLSVITGFKPSLTQFENTNIALHLNRLTQMSVSSPNTPTKDIHFDFPISDSIGQNFVEQTTQLPNGDQETAHLAHLINVVLKPWLDFGKDLNVSSLKKYNFPVVLRNSIPIIMNEFISLMNNYSTDMDIHSIASSDKNYFEFDLNKNSLEDHNNFIILFRHENLWKTKFLHESENSFSKLHMRLKNEKTKLQFPPVFAFKSLNDSNCTLNIINENKTISDTDVSDCIACRQKFLLLNVEDRNITLYLYNWSTQLYLNIVSKFSNLILWHNSRSLLLQSLILQKAGIFHNYPFKRYTFDDILLMSNIQYEYLISQQSSNIPNSFNKDKTNIYINIFKNIDLLLKHNNPYEAFQELNAPREFINKADFIFDTKNYDYIFSNFDQVGRHKNLYDCFSGQFNSNLNIYIQDLKDLSKVWQIHGTKLNYSTMYKITSHVKSYGRLSHYCLTPFLFNNKWRYMISLIRNHTLPINRSRHLSGGHVLKSKSDHEFNISKRSRRKSGPPNMLEHSSFPTRSSIEESLDMSVCPHYIQEYVQYLQSLGFIAIKSQKVNNLASRKNGEFEKHKLEYKFKPNVSINRRTSQRNEYEQFYLIKTLIGGFYLFEIGFSEPYVYSYLYSFDSRRFQSWTKSDMLNTNVINFLDELDSIKVRMHLHSFTYDYHLRAIHSYISGRQLFFHQGYHLVSFLDDFIKYYQKAPNYARNLVYSDVIKFESTKIYPQQLYNYIISHNKLYGMEVFRMNPNNNLDRNNEMNNEYVLITLSSLPNPYYKQEDNFDVGILVTCKRNKDIFFKDKTLCLKFFVLLTSQRELFPKLFSYGDNKGAFRTIRLLPSTSGSQSRRNSLVQENNEFFPSRIHNKTIYDNLVFSDNPYSGICDEKINYLGYFNAHEIVMLDILNDKVKQTKKQLMNMITNAEIDCRRDSLWNSLIANSDSQITLNEFNELLGLVNSIGIDEYDIKLAQFYSFHFDWYKSLAHKLELKFEFTHRKFQKEGSLKMAFFKKNCKDCFIMFHLSLINNKPSTPYVELRLVFKRSPSTVINTTFLQNCNPQYHELVEDFVNACTSHMWSVIL